MKKYYFALSLLFVVFLGFLDYLTGYEVSFSIFYLLPILFIVWHQGFARGIVIAVFSAIAWFSADLLAGSFYSHPFIPLWNTSVRFTFFMIIVVLVSKNKKELDLVKKMSRLDMLTTLHNATSFAEHFNIEKNRASRFQRPFTVVYFDIDNFKLLNDNFGHLKGDATLVEIGKAIKLNLRKYDIAARLGGDEFAIMFPDTDKAQAQTAMNKLKAPFLEIFKEYSIPLSFSAGAVTVSQYGYSFEDIIKAADDLMYTVKKKGKNNIACCELS